MPRNYLIEGPWIVFAVYWTIGALKTRRTVRREPFVSRYSVMLIEVTGFVMLFSGDAGIGRLGAHVFHGTPVISAIAIALTWIGIAIALWARYHLGQFWSGRVTLKEGHQLIRTGPYARLRHPIYSGLDLAVVGSALAINRWRCVVGVCIITIGFVLKAKREEALLAEQFGEGFDEHRRQTGFLLPKLW